MIATLFGIVTFLVLLYIKYRFHIQFARLAYKGIKFLQSREQERHENPSDH